MSAYQDSVNYSSCVIMPPHDLWAPFVEIKKNQMNPKIKRSPYPYITLVAPFAHPKYYPAAKSKIREELKNIEPFEINFSNFEIFRNQYSSTLYLAPESEKERTDVYNALMNILPWNIVQKQNNFEPHIGVGFFKGQKNEADIKQKKYQSNGTLEIHCSRNYFLRRKSQDSPWEVEEIVSLGKNEQISVFKIGENTDSTQ